MRPPLEARVRSSALRVGGSDGVSSVLIHVGSAARRANAQLRSLHAIASELGVIEVGAFPEQLVQSTSRRPSLV